MEGYIKLFRKIVISPIFENEKALKIWIWCLCKATHIERNQLVGQQNVSLQKGQFVFGRKKASEELKMNESTIYKYMKLLEKLEMCNIKSNNKFSIVTIENWEEYQIKDTNNNIKNDNKRTTKEHKQECKEIYLYYINKYKSENLKGFYQKMNFLNKIKTDDRYLELNEDEVSELRNLILSEN